MTLAQPSRVRSGMGNLVRDDGGLTHVELLVVIAILGLGGFAAWKLLGVTMGEQLAVTGAAVGAIAGSSPGGPGAPVALTSNGSGLPIAPSSTSVALVDGTTAEPAGLPTSSPPGATAATPGRHGQPGESGNPGLVDRAVDQALKPLHDLAGLVGSAWGLTSAAVGELADTALFVAQATAMLVTDPERAVNAARRVLDDPTIVVEAATDAVVGGLEDLGTDLAEARSRSGFGQAWEEGRLRGVVLVGVLGGPSRAMRRIVKNVASRIRPAGPKPAGKPTGKPDHRFRERIPRDFSRVRRNVERRRELQRVSLRQAMDEALQYGQERGYQPSSGPAVFVDLLDRAKRDRYMRRALMAVAEDPSSMGVEGVGAVVGVHGGPRGFATWFDEPRGTVQRTVHVEGLIDVLLRSGYDGGPILLPACSSGRCLDSVDPVAQDFVDWIHERGEDIGRPSLRSAVVIAPSRNVSGEDLMLAREIEIDLERPQWMTTTPLERTEIAADGTTRTVRVNVDETLPEGRWRAFFANEADTP